MQVGHTFCADHQWNGTDAQMYTLFHFDMQIRK